jgi:CelD/BcsL family acetyltransferase involved in cellulose biosynthesis
VNDLVSWKSLFMMRSTSMRPLRVRVITSAAELATLGPAWEALQQETSVTSIFASWDWQKSWWEQYGRGRPLRIVVAEEGGRLAGVLPLYLDEVEVLRCPVRAARLVGTGGDTSPDDLGPLLAAGREAEAATALAGGLLALPGWDVAWLTDLDPRNALIVALRQATRRAGLHTTIARAQRITFATLPPTFDAWLASLHRDRRYRVKNARKKLVAAYPDARAFVWSDAATLDAGIDRLIHLHRKRWERAGEKHGFSSPEYVAFHRAVMRACFARDRLRLHCLELSGQIVAMYYFYRFRNRSYLMQSGFDPDFASIKPGNVLLGHVIEHAISEGDDVLDFLRGDHRYKEELATGERETVSLEVYRRRPRAAVYFTGRIVLPAVKAHVKAALDLRHRRRRQDEA